MGRYYRVYRYTGQHNTSGPRSVDFSRFQIISDTSQNPQTKVARIYGMNYVHWHSASNSQDWRLRGRLVLADGKTIESNEETQYIKDNLVQFENLFEAPITPEQFAQIEKVQTLNTKDSITSDGYYSVLFWRADDNNPMLLGVDYSDIPEVQTSGIKSVNNITLNGKNTVKVVIDKLTDHARHTVEWRLGDYRYISGAVDTEASFTPPLEWLNGVTNAKTGKGTVVVRTYPDDKLEVQIGDDVTAQFTVTVPSTMRPKVTAGWAAAAPYNIGQADGIKDYIQGYSRVKITFDPSKITTMYGATIKKYSYTVQGSTVTANDHVSGVLKNSGESKIVCTVTDSRGMTNDVSLSVAELGIDVLPYAEPKLDAVTVLRSENDGPPTNSADGDVDGMYIYAQATAVVTEAVGLKSLMLMYRQKGFTTYDTAMLTSGVSKSVPGLLADRTYEAVLTVTDRLSNSYSVNFLFPHKQLSFNVKDGGKAIGIGTAPGEDNTLRVAWKVVLEEGLQSFVPVLPIGACVMLDSGKDPAEEMGGEWTEISWGNAPAGVKLWKRTK